MSDAAKRLMELFRGNGSAHGTHGVPEREPGSLKWNIKRTAQTLLKPPTETMWEQHVAGKRPLGIVPIREDNSCSWGSIDFDEYDVDVLKIVERSEQAKYPLVPCRSKSGGLHLFLFLEEPSPASEVQSTLRETAASLGLAKCEIFPKQTELLAEQRDVGNWMVMPYYGDTFGGKLKMQHGLKKSGAEMTVTEFCTFAEKRRTTVEALLACHKVVPITAGKSKRRASGDSSSPGDFTDGPPCLQHLTAAGVQTDGRKRFLFHAAVYFKRIDPDGWKRRVEDANGRYFKPPLPASEVTSIQSSLTKKDYEYTCKEEPMRSHCDSVACRVRKFGVGRGGGEFPVISGMSKLDADPPIWFVDVEGARLELSTDELQQYQRFHRACMQRVNKCYGLMKQDTWLRLVSEAMENVQIIRVPEEVSSAGRFRELLEEYLTNRAAGERREDLRAGRPWHDEKEGRRYFVLRAFVKFLTQEGVRDVTRPQIVEHVRKLGGGSHLFNFQNKQSVSTWWVPTDKIRSIGQLDTPPINGEPI